MAPEEAKGSSVSSSASTLRRVNARPGFTGSMWCRPRGEPCAATALLDEAFATIDRAEHPTVWLGVVEPPPRARRFNERIHLTGLGDLADSSSGARRATSPSKLKTRRALPER